MPQTIKGIFVMSHIHALRKIRGERAVEELKVRFGKPIDFRPSDNVPIEDENAILGHIVDICSPVQLSRSERSYEAGRLHLNNFATTPMWSILSPMVRSNPKWILLQSKYIAELVFDNVHFAAEDISPTSVKIQIDCTGYPIEHFQGFLSELVAQAGLIGAVECDAVNDGSYIYTIKWR